MYGILQYKIAAICGAQYELLSGFIIRYGTLKQSHLLFLIFAVICFSDFVVVQILVYVEVEG